MYTQRQQLEVVFGEYRIAKDHILLFSFRRALEPSKHLAQEVYNFMHGMISSCQIEFSDDVKKQIEDANQMDGGAISEYVEPFSWHSKKVLEEAVRNNPFPRSKALRD